ncbi:hypothetical protein [Methylobacterium nodulans]|uniref:Uncharacterized protein n=1 Tax=Methylobacterium nodulans (strain LMG 21967 / CNCM I-2342 / ORS 2060) TaxID=460265 RepID=B8IMX6_METNO|nr:hypothetical protein [Methylobacterium nodulans]ACL62092.1 hypothetical protein Mnod_7354 [Methylobacterium nodulans ORS 2060]
MTERGARPPCDGLQRTGLQLLGAALKGAAWVPTLAAEGLAKLSRACLDAARPRRTRPPNGEA